MQEIFLLIYLPPILYLFVREILLLYMAQLDTLNILGVLVKQLNQLVLQLQGTILYQLLIVMDVQVRQIQLL